jgi:hypothetical protein
MKRLDGRKSVLLFQVVPFLLFPRRLMHLIGNSCMDSFFILLIAEIWRFGMRESFGIPIRMSAKILRL